MRGLHSQPYLRESSRLQKGENPFLELLSPRQRIGDLEGLSQTQAGGVEEGHGRFAEAYVDPHMKGF